MDKVLEITSNDHIIMIDKLCKRILGHPEILGRIIKGFIKEAEDVSLEEIIELIKGKKGQEGNSYFQQLNNVICSSWKSGIRLFLLYQSATS